MGAHKIRRANSHRLIEHTAPPTATQPRPARGFVLPRDLASAKKVLDTQFADAKLCPVVKQNNDEGKTMKYEQHEWELNFIKDQSLHAIIATLSDNERRRICVSISGCEDESEVDAYAEAVIEQINSEKR